MDDQITEQTVEWCKSHDWGRNAYFVIDAVKGPSVVGLVEESINAMGKVVSFPVQFDSRKNLREWAGY